ncbi:hypothetical protein DITRI_Ditri18aG0008400 [Diplodiscus trichospermus]
MAAALEQPVPMLSSKVKAKAFLDKYYHFLLQSSKFVNRFYRDSSKISWTDQDWVISHVTTMKALSDRFRSFVDAKKYDILTFDTQDSLDDGLVVSIVGCMTLKNDETKMFNQSFFLVPDQEESFFVFNDIFRFHDDKAFMKFHDDGDDETSNQEAKSNKPFFHQDVANAFVTHYHQYLRGFLESAYKFYEDSSKYEILSYDVQDSCDNGLFLVVIGRMTSNNGNEPKKFSQSFFLATQPNGYFVLNDVLSSSHDTAPDEETTTDYSLDSTDQNNAANSVNNSSKNGKPFSNYAAEISDTSASKKGTIIFVGNLGDKAEVEELREAFKRFGAIKPNGVHIRRNKHKGCYAFVEFESPSSVRIAVHEASSIRIQNQKISVRVMNFTRG